MFVSPYETQYTRDHRNGKTNPSRNYDNRKPSSIGGRTIVANPNRKATAKLERRRDLYDSFSSHVTKGQKRPGSLNMKRS